MSTRSASAASCLRLSRTTEETVLMSRSASPGVSRFTVEFFREPDVQRMWVVDSTGLSMGQWLTVPMILIGVWLVATAKKRRQRVEPIAGPDAVA